MKITKFTKIYTLATALLLGSFFTLSLNGYRLLSAPASFRSKSAIIFIPGSTLHHK